jgi:hypothetical protein
VAGGDRQALPRRRHRGRLLGFELERSGAAAVTAIDLSSYFQSKARTRLASELRGSCVSYQERSVYDVEGEFRRRRDRVLLSAFRASI